MMPVGTPPNAIVFGSGLITLPQMARAGMLLNLALVPIILVLVWLLGGLVFDLEVGVVPPWVSK
jgi:sodium-dependent dicarboxylate transporter 2/3/5